MVQGTLGQLGQFKPLKKKALNENSFFLLIHKYLRFLLLQTVAFRQDGRPKGPRARGDSSRVAYRIASDFACSLACADGEAAVVTPGQAAGHVRTPLARRLGEKEVAARHIG